MSRAKVSIVVGISPKHFLSFVRHDGSLCHFVQASSLARDRLSVSRVETLTYVHISLVFIVLDQCRAYLDASLEGHDTKDGTQLFPQTFKSPIKTVIIQSTPINRSAAFKPHKRCPH